MNRNVPKEILELYEALEKSGFNVRHNTINRFIIIDGQIDLIYKKDGKFHIEIRFNDLKLLYIEENGMATVLVLKLKGTKPLAEGVRVTEYSILKEIRIDNKYELAFEKGSFSIGY
jgi:hypothetical protein